MWISLYAKFIYRLSREAGIEFSVYIKIINPPSKAFYFRCVNSWNKFTLLHRWIDLHFYTFSFQVPWPSDIYILAFYYSYLRARAPTDEFKQYEVVLGAALAGNTSEAWQMIKNLDLIKRNFLQLSVTMDDTMVFEEDKPAIAVSAIVGSLGGILNLYIGFNLITVADFLDFFLTLIIDYLVSRKAKVEQEKTTSKAPELQITTVEPFRI